MNKLLSMKDIAKEYNRSEENLGVLKHIKFLVDETELFSIVGPFESGKQPMMPIIGCLDVLAYEQCEHEQISVASTALIYGELF